MSNNILNIDMITNKSLEILENNLVLSRNVNRQYDNSFGQTGAMIGTDLRVRLPDRALVSDGAALQVQEENQQYVTVSVTSQKHTGINFTSAELALKLDDFSERILVPRISQLASTVDSDLANVYKYIGNSVGTPGTTPSSELVLLQAQQKLNEMAAPMSQRYATVNPAASTGLIDGFKGLFNPGDLISRQFKTGLLNQAILGFDEVSMSHSIKSHTCGSRNATGGTLSAAVTTEGATTIAITGAGASATVKQGDVFTVADCYAVNPQTRESTGSLFQFVVLADVTLNGSGAGNLTVAAMYSAGQALATVDVLPQSGKAVVFMGAASGVYPQSLVYHKNAIVLASADLVLPEGPGTMASRAVHNGISMSIVKQFDIYNYRYPCRVDVLYGYKVVRPELACRVWG